MTRIRRWKRSVGPEVEPRTDRTRTAFALVGLMMSIVAAAGPITAQDTAREQTRGLVSEAVYLQLDSVVAAATARGVPEEALFTKALEGVSKNIAPERLVPAIVAYGELLETARSALGPEATLPTLVAGGDAIRRGVSVESIREMPTGERTPMTLVVLADLVESGVPSEDAVSVVREAVARQTAEESMLAIPGAIRDRIRDGQTARAAADAVRRAIRDGRPIRRIPRGDVSVRVPAPPGSDPVTRDRSRGGG